jgi:hypothetical protein
LGERGGRVAITPSSLARLAVELLGKSLPSRSVQKSEGVRCSPKECVVDEVGGDVAGLARGRNNRIRARSISSPPLGADGSMNGSVPTNAWGGENDARFLNVEGGASIGVLGE